MSAEVEANTKNDLTFNNYINNLDHLKPKVNKVSIQDSIFNPKSTDKTFYNRTSTKLSSRIFHTTVE